MEYIEIGSNDAAIIFKENGYTEIHIPEGDPVPQTVGMMMHVITFMQSEKLVKIVCKMIERNLKDETASH